MPGTVLVVDDDPAFRSLASRLLRDGGFTVIGEAAGVAEASASAARLLPDLALVDIALPDGSGLDLAQALSALPVPVGVLLISSDADPAFGPAARRAGARGFLPKDQLTAAGLAQLLGPMSITATPALRVVIGEDDVLLREGVSRLLVEAGFDVVAQAGDAKSLVGKVLAYRPDVAIVDVRMPPHHEHDGLVAAVELRRALPQTAVLILSQFYEPSLALQLIGDDPHGVGYLLKERVGDVHTFVDAIHRVVAGGCALDPEVVARLVGRRLPGEPLHTLSPTERAVLGAMAEGKSNVGIATALSISEASVEKCVTAIFRKLGIGPATGEHRRVHAVLTYLRGTAVGR